MKNSLSSQLVESKLTSLYDMVNEGLEYTSKDYKKFMRDYKKFNKYLEENEVKLNDQEQHAINQITEWIKSLGRYEGLPYSYARYEQFTYAIVTFDSSAREGAGDLYDKKVTDKLIDLWEKATGYKIKNQYK